MNLPEEVVMSPTRVAAIGLALVSAFAASQAVALSAGSDFYTLMDDAMARMHTGMHVEPSGDVDRDFARMMVPHHQGAIDMAILELRFGHDQRLRRLAQAIVVEQGQEIQLMQSILTGGGAAGKGN
jgi:uncharacterized protein (DUF305 family)